MDAQAQTELMDLLYSIDCKIQTCRVLIAEQFFELLPTQLEHIHEDSQKIIDDFCIKT